MSKYCYQPHGHIITGDLKIIENIKLREFVCKGPKYLEPNKINWKARTRSLNPFIFMLSDGQNGNEIISNISLNRREKLKELVPDRISGLKGKFKRPNQKILNDPRIKDCLRKLHEDFVLVPADKAANNIVICKAYYVETLTKEIGINSLDRINSTYVPSTYSYEKILKSHSDFVTSVGLKLSEEDQDLPCLYWTPKLHKTPFKHRFIAGSSKCTTKELSCLLTKILTTIKDRLSRYCNTKISYNGVNIWILKNSISLLSSLQKLDVRYAKSVLIFDFSTLYTSIPHDLL